MTLSRNPNDSVILRYQDSLTLTCTIQLDPAVNSDVMVMATLSGPQGTASPVMGSQLMYQITLQENSLLATDSPETYTCSVTIIPVMDFIASSQEQSDMLDITVGEKRNHFLIQPP